MTTTGERTLVCIIFIIVIILIMATNWVSVGRYEARTAELIQHKSELIALQIRYDGLERHADTLERELATEYIDACTGLSSNTYETCEAIAVRELNALTEESN